MQEQRKEIPYDQEENATPEIENVEEEPADFWKEVQDNIRDDTLKAMHDIGIQFTTYTHSLISYNRSMVFELLGDLQTMLLEPLANIICNAIKDDIPEENRIKTFNTVMKITKTFELVKTEYKLMAYLKENKLYNMPSLDPVTCELEARPAITGEGVNIIECSKSNVYVGLENFFRHIFAIEDNLTSLISHYEEIIATPMEQMDNFIKAKFWQDKIKRYSGKICIPYFLFADFFEVNNPLGPKAGKQALTGYYLNFPSLPRHIYGKVENMFLIKCSYSETEKEFTNEETMHTLITEIAYLESNSLEFIIKNKTIDIFFLFGGLRGDNLGLNSMMDYSKSFVAKHPCRIWSIDIDNQRKAVVDDPNLYRTVESYEYALQHQTFTESGIQRDSVFNKIPGLHVTDLKIVDAMHDYFEGYAHDAITVCLNTFLSRKYFTLEDLNDRVKFFDYEINDRKNIPVPIKREHLESFKLKMTASQMKSFIENISLMIGDFVPDVPEWEFLIDTVRIGFFLMKSSFTDDSVEEMRNLIAKNLNEYQCLFGKRLKPKGHFLTHYHLSIKWNGPTKFTACFIPEMKHKTFKTIANNTSSRKNIALTVAIKDQLRLAYGMLTQKNNFNKPVIELKKGYFCSFGDMQISETFQDIDNNMIVQVYKNAILGAAKIRVGSVLIGLGDAGYDFREVQHILKVEDNVLFICHLYKNVVYNQRIDGYILQSMDYSIVKVQASDIAFYPNRFHKLPDGRVAIRIKN